MTTEPEFTAADGTVRKTHYGDGEQPWDAIVRLGWGAEFAAGNVLKYVRRHAQKNGADDLEKARWYLTELRKMTNRIGPALVLSSLARELTVAELELLRVNDWSVRR